MITESWEGISKKSQNVKVQLQKSSQVSFDFL